MIAKIWKQLRSDWVRVLTALVMACLIYLMRSDFLNKNTVTRDIDNIPVELEFLSSDIINLDINIPCHGFFCVKSVNITRCNPDRNNISA